MFYPKTYMEIINPKNGTIPFIFHKPNGDGLD